MPYHHNIFSKIVAELNPLPAGIVHVGDLPLLLSLPVLCIRLQLVVPACTVVTVCNKEEERGGGMERKERERGQVIPCIELFNSTLAILCTYTA